MKEVLLLSYIESMKKIWIANVMNNNLGAYVELDVRSYNK